MTNEKKVNEIIENFEEIREDIEETSKDIDELHAGVEKLKEGQKSILQRISSRIVPDEFAWDDLAQQIVGAIILSTPLAVTQEVWQLAQELDITRAIAIFAITLLFNILLIHYTKYQAVKRVKLRILSQMTVSYISAAGLLFVFGVIGTEIIDPTAIIKLVLFVGLFANIGAGTADILK